MSLMAERTRSYAPREEGETQYLVVTGPYKITISSTWLLYSKSTLESQSVPEVNVCCSSISGSQIKENFQSSSDELLPKI